MRPTFLDDDQNQKAKPGSQEESLTSTIAEEKNLQPPQNQLRKRASSTAIREQLESRKRPDSNTRKDKSVDENIDNDVGKDSTEEKGDNEASEIEDGVEMVQIALAKLNIKQRRKETEERGKNERGWVKNDIKVVYHCAICGGRTKAESKCRACIAKLCQSWLGDS